MVRRRSRLDSEVDYTRNADENSQILLRERHEILRWKTAVEIKTPNLFIPTQIATYVESLPFAKVAVAQTGDRIAVMSHSRKLEIFGFDGQSMVAQSEIEVLPDDFASYCLLDFSDSGSLLLSTRSEPFIDIFDRFGYHCYTIPLESPQSNFDLLTAVSCIQSSALGNSDESNKFLDTLYVMQYNGTFSIFKIGRLSGYFKTCSVSLDIGLCGAFRIISSCNLLLVAAHYKGVESMPLAGLNSFRLVDSDPYVEPIRTSSGSSNSWMHTLARLPFSSSSYCFLSSLAIDHSSTHLCAVSTNGDFFAFELPSTRLSFSVPYISGSKPQQVTFVDEQEVCVLLSCGGVVRTDLSSLKDALYEARPTEKFASRSTLTTPCNRQLFVLENDGVSEELCEAASQRASLAARLWLSTFWTSFKLLVGMAVGDAGAPLHKATHVESLEFTLWHAPTVTLQELFERTLNEKDYSRARSLATSYQSIDSDIVLKREWKDACEKGMVTVADVQDILGEISDVEFRSAACWASHIKDREVEKALIEMGMKMEDEAPTESMIHILHSARILNVIEDHVLYLEMKDKSLLEIAGHLAERVELSTLERLLSSNLPVLSPYSLSIVSRIPSCVPPNRYKEFLPIFNGDNLQIEELPNVYCSKLEELSRMGDLEELLVQQVNWGMEEEGMEIIERLSGSAPFPQWALERGNVIDEETGLPSHVVQLYNIAIQHGFENMKPDLLRWQQYETHVNNCALTNATMEKFVKMGVQAMVQQYTKLTEDELVDSMDSLISLTEWKLRESAARQEGADKQNTITYLLPLLLEYSRNSVKVLESLKKLRPEMVTDDVISKCLCEYQGTGKELHASVSAFSLPSTYSVCLLSLLSRGVSVHFSNIHESLKDKKAAMGLLIRLTRSAKCCTAMEWETLRDDVIGLAESVYPSLIDKDEALEVVVKEFLDDQESSCAPDRLELFLTLSPPSTLSHTPTGPRLDKKKSGEILLWKSEECIQQATGLEDGLIRRAKFLAQSASKLSKSAAEQLRSIDTVELSLELGTRKMPVAIRYTDPYVLLDEVVAIGRNYKQGKKVAKLALLLGIDTPVASALSMCALTALKREDEEVCKKYLHEVMAKARNIEKVHQLCVQLIKSPYLKSMKDDIYACAILNSPSEALMETMELIAESREQQREEEREDNERKPLMEGSEELVMDPMYTKASQWEKPSSSVDPLLIEHAKHPLSIDELARLLSHASATEALCTTMMIPEEFKQEVPWTNNDFLKSYESALRFYWDKLTPRLIEFLPPHTLINMMILEDEDCKPLDRIATYGCDRERFIEDVEYRKETIIGLAMSEDSTMFEDARELAVDFKLDLFDVHFASLENAITGLPLSDAKQMIKTRGHVPVLLEQSERYHELMRSSVLPLVVDNDTFRLYLSVFGKNSIESKSIPFIKMIEQFADKNKIRVQLRRCLSEVSYLSQLIFQFNDAQIDAIAPLLQELPIAHDVCDSLCRLLLEGTTLRPPSSPHILWKLCREDEEVFLEIVAIKQRDDEISYLTSIPLDLSPEGMVHAVERRLRELRVDDETEQRESMGREETQTSGWGDWGSFLGGGGGSDGGGLVNRRRK